VRNPRVVDGADDRVDLADVDWCVPIWVVAEPALSVASIGCLDVNEMRYIGDVKLRPYQSVHLLFS